MSRQPRKKRHRAPAWLKNAVFYQIYPQSFLDTNGDGIGDLRGIAAKLDYFQYLGVNALWLSPIFASPFQDAGYDVSDFYQIAPRYGTLADFKNLLAEAAKRGIRICLDLVAGHTSNQHPWFQASASANPNRHTNWYVWTNSAWDALEPNVIRGYSDRDGSYLPNFFYFQPALNYGYYAPDPKKPWQLPVDHPNVQAVRKELRKIMKFWLDLGVSGFRVDMAASLVRGDKDGKGIVELWRYYREWLDREYPEAVLISEWCNPRQAVAAGFDIDFLIHFGEPAYNSLFGTPWGDSSGDKKHGPPAFFDRKGTGDIRRFLDNYLEHYLVTNGHGYISLPTGNHDFPRHRRSRDERDLRVIYAMLFTLPGVPFIYYGDEIGMRYLENLTAKEGSFQNRTGSRTPMQWTSGKNRGFSSASQKKLYLPIDPASDAPNVATQIDESDSLLHFVRRLLKLRRTLSALGNSAPFEAVYAKKGKYPFVFERKIDLQSIWIAINPSEQPVEIILPKIESVKSIESLGSSMTASAKNCLLKMEAASFGIFQISK